MNTAITPSDIKNLIHHIRGKAVMLDSDLADLYQVPTGRLNEAVRRNAKRFPEDFMFRLTREEFKNLISQIATSSSHGGRRKLPLVFTEQGVAMLSGARGLTGPSVVMYFFLRCARLAGRIFTDAVQCALRTVEKESGAGS